MSNGLNLTIAMIQPERDFAMVMATNVGGAKAQDASHVVAEAAVCRYGAAASP